jgi:energy-coupling factor transporter ATP-binding protein EcfA2
MYNAFFGLKENPFNLSPDPAFLYRSAQHEEALANLIYGVQSRKGFIVLSGEVGTGKSTMLECLRDYLNAQQICFASLFNSRLTVEQFFEFAWEENHELSPQRFPVGQPEPDVKQLGTLHRIQQQLGDIGIRSYEIQIRRKPSSVAGAEFAQRRPALEHDAEVKDPRIM